MSISTPSAPKKRGMGCLGCGCFILALLVFLVFGLVGGMAYWCYAETIALTSTTPAAVPTFNGSDDLYLAAKQKLADFDHDVKYHQAATIRLSADEINTLLARDPDAIKNNIHVFVTLANNEARVQASFPTDVLSHGLINGRYSNFDTSFEVNFDLSTRSVLMIFHKIEFGDKTLLAPNSDNDKTASASSFNRSVTLWYTSIFNQSINQVIRKNPDGGALLDQAKSIEIKDGQLVIETR